MMSRSFPVVPSPLRTRRRITAQRPYWEPQQTQDTVAHAVPRGMAWRASRQIHTAHFAGCLLKGCGTGCQSFATRPTEPWAAQGPAAFNQAVPLWRRRLLAPSVVEEIKPHRCSMRPLRAINGQPLPLLRSTSFRQPCEPDAQYRRP